MIARQDEDGTPRCCEKLGNPRDHMAVHSVVLECVAGKEDKINRFASGQVANSLRRLNPGGPNRLSRPPGVYRPHPNLPVRRVNESHDTIVRWLVAHGMSHP
jgi:hypothetical protein